MNIDKVQDNYHLIEERLEPTEELGVYSLFRLFKNGDSYYELIVPKIEITSLTIEEESTQISLWALNSNVDLDIHLECVGTIQAKPDKDKKLFTLTRYSRQ